MRDKGDQKYVPWALSDENATNMVPRSCYDKCMCNACMSFFVPKSELIEKLSGKPPTNLPENTNLRTT